MPERPDNHAEPERVEVTHERERVTVTNGEKSPDQKLEEVDGKVDDLQVRVAVLDTRVKIGFGVLGVLVASPKLGGPTAEQVAAAVVRLLGF